MKNTGMIRRLDELGRIVIPKEIRTSLKLREGNQVEIYINDSNNIVLKQYYPVANFVEISKDFCTTLNDVLNKSVFICDRVKIVAFSGDKTKLYLNKPVNQKLSDLVCSSDNYIANVKEGTTILDIVDDIKNECLSQLFLPIIVFGKCEGMIGILSFDDKNAVSLNDINAVQVAIKFMKKQLEYD